MARLHEISESEDDLPDISTILYPAIHDQRKPLINHDANKRTKKEQETSASTEESKVGLVKMAQPKDDLPVKVKKASSEKKQARKQRSMRLAQADSLLLPLSANPIQTKEVIPKLPIRDDINSSGRISPKKVSTYQVNYAPILSDLPDALQSNEQEDFYESLSDFIVDDSDSELDTSVLRPVGKDRRRSPKKNSKKPKYRGSNAKPLLSRSEQPPTLIDLTSPLKESGVVSGGELLLTERSVRIESQGIKDLFYEDGDANLRFSPPRSMSPKKYAEEVRFVTPPQSPSKPKLQSPSKSQRIPPSPHRPSIDAFWSQDVINDWNDQYSPRKTPRSRRPISLNEDDSADDSPSTSPRKSPFKTPARKDKQAIAAKRLFNEQKHSLAISFLQELDRTIANSRVSDLASSTGGIHILWSKKLSSTAGRANWKREAIRSETSVDPGVAALSATTKVTYRHHASIELAEKVIDDSDRLLNVLAHEYCHLANFMLSHCTTAPHGASFKSWARKVSTAFAHCNVLVTTKHSYAIEYKYIWACEG
ncbi:MAG: hypothetical protein Q9187_003559, partial [Circinaria calcarea]